MADYLWQASPSNPPVVVGVATFNAAAYIASFAPAGGFTATVTAGSLPPGLTFSGFNPVLQGTPTLAGVYTFTIQITDGGSHTATGQFIVEVLSSTPAAFFQPGASVLLTGVVPGVWWGASYGSATSGWTVVAGSLPDGISIDSATGLFTGTAGTPGIYNFQVSVGDTSLGPSTQWCSLTISPTQNLAMIAPPITVGVPYSFQFDDDYALSVFNESSAGPPYTYTVDSSHPIPSDLTLSSSGLLSGTLSSWPLGPETYEAVQIDIEDSGAGTHDNLTEILILGGGSAPPSLGITCGNPPNGQVGQAYTNEPGFPATGGATPYSFALIDDTTLPPGLSLDNSTGIVTGTPTAQGTFPFTVQVTDADSNTASVECSIAIIAAALTGNVYTLNPQMYTDDDFGQINPYYVTYGHPDRDTEQQMQLGGGLKMLTYLQSLFAGVGNMNWSILCNTLANPWPLVGIYPMSQNPLRNAEWAAGQATAQRFFVKFASSPNPEGDTPNPATDNAFSLSVLVVGIKPNARMKVAGSYP